MFRSYIWVKVFENGPSKNFLKVVFQKFLLGPFLNTLTHLNHKVPGSNQTGRLAGLQVLGELHAEIRKIIRIDLYVVSEVVPFTVAQS